MRYRFYFALCLCLVFCCCKQKNDNSYAIRDFRPELQPVLKKIVAKGYLQRDASTNWLEQHATPEEQRKLAVAEDALLRAVALRMVVDRPAADSTAFILAHLDDTAMVPYYKGEWGIDLATVSDDMLDHIEWKSQQQLDIVTDEVLMKHYYLAMAYRALRRVKPEEKYYAMIKKMALREVRYDNREVALRALAAYKKPEDIALIAAVMKENEPWWSWESFDILKAQHNPEYFALLEAYYYGQRLHHVLGKYSTTDAGNLYVHAVASYQDKKSAALLKEILQTFSFYPTPNNKIYEFEHHLKHAIWSNRCSVYASLLPQIKDYVVYNEMTQQGIIFNSDTLAMQPRRITW